MPRIWKNTPGLSDCSEVKKIMTRRLYYTDSYLKEFSGMVLERREFEKRPAVILDQTAFYPESGGQPCDTGTLNGARVLKVLEDESGSILHLLEREIAIGVVVGTIDWTHRFDHMQQHTGQHILSQAFLSVAQAQTLSFHMGIDVSTIDINLAQPSTEQLEEVQTLAANVVFQNRAVQILAADRESLSSLGVRKESQREGEIRIIDVEGFDRSPCGGTHVRSTGEIGIIFVSNLERYKGGTRVEFVAGGRALKLLHRDHELLKQLARIHSAAPDKLIGIAEKLLQERTALIRENDRLQGSLLEMEAAELLQSTPKTERGYIVSKSFSGRSLESIKALAQKLTANSNVVAILGIPDACQIVLARSKNLPGNCGDAVKKVAGELGGKGGGRSELAQAGGFPADHADLWMKALTQYFQN